MLDLYLSNIAKNDCKETSFQIKKTSSKSRHLFESYDAKAETHIHADINVKLITPLFLCWGFKKTYVLVLTILKYS